MVDLHRLNGIPSSVRNLWKAYKSILRKFYQNKKYEAKVEAEANSAANVKAHEDPGDDRLEDKSMNGVDSFRYNGDGIGGNDPTSPRRLFRHQSVDNCFPSITSPLSRCGAKRSKTPTRSSVYRSVSREGSTDAMPSPGSMRQQSTNSNPSPPSLSKGRSGRSSISAPIMFSNSSGMLKPAPIEKKLDCTLEELCYGCKRKIKITRDVVTNTGEVTQEEELLTIKVKPGWKKGTKITFEGMGNKRPGSSPADITFVITEKRHPLFRREGDDLELAVEIPLVKALTGCTLSIPLLGGEQMSLTIDDIIYPGYEKIIAAKGMPNSKEQGKRGSLKIEFLVQFPTELTDEQRSDILGILENSC
ncbi:dnaJ protein homolog 1 [Alnus glutinosa]|uniref:dnaJ protein homolog 1 n=1 Tax=Alnus glutinosa TaxID=3517 RepID=UPI002D79D1FF|nr:dnaJ protein homolog 1 [Alnus glutinosa]